MRVGWQFIRTRCDDPLPKYADDYVHAPPRLAFGPYFHSSLWLMFHLGNKKRKCRPSTIFFDFLFRHGRLRKWIFINQRQRSPTPIRIAKKNKDYLRLGPQVAQEVVRNEAFIKAGKGKVYLLAKELMATLKRMKINGNPFVR